MERQTGTVRKFDKTYGFIRPDNGHGKDVFVHYTEIESEGVGRRTLAEGQIVSFEVEEAEKGPKAVRVRIEG